MILMRIKTKISTAILKAIEEYDTIMIFRHTSPDFDALGSQFALLYWLRLNFPDKKIYVPGYSYTEVGRNLFPKNDVLKDEVFDQRFLAIILDTSNHRRISDERYKKAAYIIKIDHHPDGDAYGDINLVMPEAGAAAELLYTLFRTKAFRKYPIPDEVARYLYVGIVGDTGRFQYSAATAHTLKCAAELYQYDFDPQKDVYYPIYNKPLSDFEAVRTVMNNFRLSEDGVAYYILTQKELERLKIDADEGKAYLYLFNYCDEILVWCSFCEDKRRGDWRGSLRSRDVTVNEVASHFRGGGHRLAAGCRPKNRQEIKQCVAELGQEIKKMGVK